MLIYAPAVDGIFSVETAELDADVGPLQTSTDNFPVPTTDPVPITDVGDAVDVYVEIRNFKTMERLGVLRTANIDTVEWEHNSVGQAVFTWSVDPDEEPEGGVLVSGFKPLTWRDAPIEAWIYRHGVCVFRGPIVRQRHIPASGRVEAVAWTREGFLQRLILGLSPRVNYLPWGYFDTNPSLSQWTADGMMITTVAGPEQYLYRRPRSMRIEGYGQVYSSATFDASPHTNVVYILMVLKYQAGSWPGDEVGSAPVVGRIAHRLLDSAGNDVRPAHMYDLQIYSNDEPGQWVRVEKAIQQTAGYRNRYEIYLTGPGTGRAAWIGEVEYVRNANVGARPGNDYSAFVQAVLTRACEYMGDHWSTNVGPTGKRLKNMIRAEDADHPDFRSLLSDIEAFGDWWVEDDPVTFEPVAKFRPKRGKEIAEIDLTLDISTNVQVDFDASLEEVATHAITLSDGLEGPTREEAHARLTDMAGALLVRCDFAPRGTMPRDLQDVSTETLLNESGVRPVFSGDLAVGPARGWGPDPFRDLSGVWLHRIGPGDWVKVRVRQGRLDYVLEARVQVITWTPKDDKVTITWFGPQDLPETTVETF